jgi:hypothetical protein
MPSKTGYYVHENMDTTGMEILAIYDDLSIRTIRNGFTFFPIRFTTEGAQEVTVTYMGKEAHFTVDVLMDPDQAALSAAPEKVQVQGTSGGAVEFNYASVLSGGSNRQGFVEAVLDMTASGKLLILAGGRWYDVNGVTLREAILNGRTGVHDANGLYTTDDGRVISARAWMLVDQINIAYPLTEQPQQIIGSLFNIYQGLSDEDKLALADDEAVQDLVGVISEE